MCLVLMTLNIMDTPPPAVGNPAIAHLCDVILETLRGFGNAAEDVKAFRNEVQTLRKFLDLIKKILRANQDRMAFEEEHFGDVKVLLDRCHASLSRLCAIFANLRAKYDQTAPQNALLETVRDMRSQEILALRARLGFYVQSLQMSLQTVRLYAYIHIHIVYPYHYDS